MKIWHPITVAEMYVFMALTMLMAHVKKHRIADYWITEDLISTPSFGKFMARDRYLAILSNLHFVTNTNIHLPDPLWKVRGFYDMMRQRFKAFLRPYQKLVTDESLVLYRGNLHFRQYIPSKRHRFGIKLFVLCDCKTGYVLDYMIYSGKGGEIVTDPDVGFSGAVVKSLVEQYYGKNHILYTDNYYTSPHLAQFLHENDTQLVGTVRENRKDMPHFPKKTKKKDLLIKQHGPILAIHWHDQRRVNMLTTIHKGEVQDSGKVDHRTRDRVLKPDAVLDYVKNMRLVDKSDMQVGFIDSLRTCCRWYKKFFLHIMDVSVLNAYNIYKLLNPTTPRKYKNLRRFQKQIIEDLLETHLLAPTRAQSAGGPGVTDRTLCADFMRKHQLVPHPEVGGRKAQRRCYVCSNTTRRPRKVTRTSYECQECQVSLCISPCFADFHTYQKF